MTAAQATRGRGRPPLELDEPAVLRAAIEAFADEGLRGTSMERVAARCGVAKATLHGHFGSKAELFQQAMAQEWGRLTEHLLAAYAAGERLGPTDQLRNGYVAMFDYAREQPAVFRLLFGGSDEGGSAVSWAAGGGRAVVVREIARLVAALSARGGRAARQSTEVIAEIIVGAGEHVARRLAANPDLDAEAVTDLVVEVIAHGVLGADATALARFDAAADASETTSARG